MTREPTALERDLHAALIEAVGWNWLDDDVPPVAFGTVLGALMHARRATGLTLPDDFAE